MAVEVDGSRPHFESLIPTGAVVREGPAISFEPLKPGPGKSPEQVGAHQIARIHRAMIELAADKGYERVNVRGLTHAAGVSSRTFYIHFSNLEECFGSTVDTVGHRFLDRAARREFENDWQGQMTASLSSLLGDFADQPRAARLLLVEAPIAGRPGRTRAIDLTSHLERLFARLLAAAPLAPAPPNRLVVGIAAGVIRVATTTTLTGRAAELPALVSELGDWVFDVYDERSIALCKSSEARRGRRREPAALPAEWSAFGGHSEEDRILAAASRLAVGRGLATLTVSKIRREAGVSRRSFDARFRDVTECFLATVDSLARVAASKADAWAIRTGGREQLNGRVMLALSAMVARNQPEARMVLEGILVPGRDGILLRERLISEAAERLADGGRSRSCGSPLTAEASVAAAWRIAQREVHAGRAQGLPRQASLLSFLIGRPCVDSVSI
ncbi:MAG: TetR/AcrR family transcriptional regulator [Actinobacteria bacterium]|nr:TetR/AcrR family transcriptional regulator [Actinomycetota bacterium]